VAFVPIFLKNKNEFNFQNKKKQIYKFFNKGQIFKGSGIV